MKPKPKSLLEYKSVQNAFQNMTLSKGEPPSEKTQNSYTGVLSYFILFCNSEEGSKREWNPDLLIEEAKGDMKKAQLKIVNYFQWLQGEKVPGYKPWGKKISASSARQRAYSAIRGFYSNNDVMFPKGFKCPALKAPETIQADQTVPFFK
jgi:hypothetical protein